MVQIKLKDGVIEGEFVKNEYGPKYYSFKGIPYAEPPVGDLRFKAPKAIKPWKGVRSAKEYGPRCYQREIFIPPYPVGGSEDCLYLNVFSPDVKPKTPLPVMVWIHGGGFRSGSGNDTFYGPEFLVRQGVILVTFNYRLGIIGFLCLNTEDIPGNAGMKDQVLALKWVKNNISHFGGDPENITIFGESAGGASVGCHLISPMSKGLFKRAIAQSGCALNYWANTQLDPREKALSVARHFGLYSNDDKELYEFFKNLPIEKLIDINITSMIVKKDYDLELSIVNEKQFGNNERFLYGDIYDLLRSNIHEGVEIMTGYTEDESMLALLLATIKGDQEALFKLSNNYLEFFVPRRLTMERPVIEQFEIGRKVRNYYFKNGLNSYDNFEGLFKFISMDFCVYETVSFAKFCAKTKKNNVFLYKFTCKSERTNLVNVFNLRKYYKDRTPVGHGDEIAYLFLGKLSRNKTDQKSDAFKEIEKVTRLWTNFAKYGNPTPDNSFGVKWLPYTLENQHYMDIGDNLVPGSSPEKQDIALFDEIFKAHDPRTVVQ